MASVNSDCTMEETPSFSSEPPQSEAKPQKHRPVSPVPSCVSMKSDRSMREPPLFSNGPPQTKTKPQTHRPVSPVPSCVSLKSDRSMGEPLNFSNGPPQSEAKPQTHRPVSPVPSCVSMKSDRSMGEPPSFSSGPPQTETKPQAHRPVSPVPSCVSLKSDRSMGEPLNFSSGPPQSEAKPQTHRPVSPVPSCVSMKSDRSMREPPLFSNGPPQTETKPQTHRPVSPVPSCVSLKSDRSMGEPLNFSNGPPQSEAKRKVLTRDQSRCGVCKQLLRDPVITTCGHSFCRQCISSYWSQSGPSGDYSCPQCRGRSRTQPLLNADITMAQPPLYPSTATVEPPIYPSTPTAQSSLYQHREMAKPHLTPSTTMAQVPLNPHTDTRQHPLDPDIAQISPQPAAENTIMEGNETLQTEHPRTKLTDDQVLNRVQMTHKASMKRRFQTICEGIKRPGTQTLLNKIHTDLYITEGESEGVNNEHEVWQVESASRLQTTEETAINCNDIFKPLPGQESHIKTVMTKGIAGIGKTVSVQKFILDWAEEKANQDVDFMFVLPFRELNLVKHDQYSLHRLLLDFHPELRELQNTAYKDCHIVFIFDGLDESRLPLNFQENQKLSDVLQTSSVDALMTSLIQGTLLSSALTWITSRPAAASQIPSQFISLVTEIRGFRDPQKEEYFRKRIIDQNQANKMISHIKAFRSLHIMCHMPVFCWISATVLQQILEQNDVRETPRTLTDMFIHFLLIQTTRRNQKYEGGSGTDRQRLLESQKGVILKLAELAFKNLENGNLMFYEEDLRECGIDVSEASVYSGMCTEIFREECVFHYKKVYCFVHLSIQEFLAALYLFASFLSKNTMALKSFICEDDQFLTNPSLEKLLWYAVNRALESKSGHLDLFVRFLHGISLESNQRLLIGLLPRIHSSPESVKKTIKNLKVMGRPNSSPERCINLIHCLVEMNDSSVHDETQVLIKGNANKQLSLAHCSALAHVLLMSDEVLDEFDLKKYNTSEEGRRRLLPAVRCCRKALLADCKLTETSCEVVASALRSRNSPLRELDLSFNDLQMSGEKLLPALHSPNCKLETLRLAGCNLTEESCKVVTSALQSLVSLTELDLSHNNLRDSGVQLSARLSSPACKLQTLRLAGCNLTEESCKAVGSALQSLVSLTELDLSHNNLKDIGVQLSAGLSHPDCKLQKLRLASCNLTEESCKAVVSALQSSVSLTELDLSYSNLKDSGVQLFSEGLSSPHCKLQTLRLAGCNLTEESCKAVVSALQSLVSLTELDLSHNHLKDSAVQLLSARLSSSHCKLQKLRLAGCHLTEESCEAVVSALQSLVSLTELDLSDNDLKDSGVQLSAGLNSLRYQLQTLRLAGCNLTDESCKAVASALQHLLSLTELDLSRNELKGAAVQLLSAGLSSSHCQLQILRLAGCNLAEESCKAVVSALQSLVSLTELDLSHNHLKDSAVQLLSAELSSPRCKLQILRLAGCNLTDESYKAVGSALQSLVSLTELDLSHNHLRDSAVQLLSAGLSSPHCKLQILRLDGCGLTEAVVSALQSFFSLTELDLSYNHLKDSAVQLLSAGLSSPQCKLQKLRLAGCKLTEESCKAVVSALQSLVSLTELDLSYNHLRYSAVQLLSAGLSSPHCKLQILRLAGCKLTEESCKAVASALQSSVSLTELHLSHNHLKDSAVQLLSAGLSSPHCKLQILRLTACNLTDESYKAVVSALQSLVSLTELDLSYNHLKDSAVQLLSAGLSSPHCKLQILRLAGCNLTDESCKAVVSALQSSVSLTELHLSHNHLKDSAVQLLSAGLSSPHCKLQILRLAGCKLTEESCKAVGSALQSLVSLTELDLSDNDLKDSAVQLLSAELSSPHCKLQILRLAGCKLTEESCKAVVSALQSLVSLTELHLSHNELNDSAVQLLSAGLSSPHCKLQILRLAGCKLTEESCKAVVSALQSLVSLTELDLSYNHLKDSGVQLFSAGLSSPHCKLQILRLAGGCITAEGCSFLASALKSNPSYLKELDLRGNPLQASSVRELTDRLNDPNCKLETFRY